jgi:hypothetical protein
MVIDKRSIVNSDTTEMVCGISQSAQKECLMPDAGLTIDFSDIQALRALTRGMAVSQMVGAACEIGLPDALEPETVVSVARIADQLRVNSNVLWRLCRTLASFGIFIVDAQSNVRHNGLSLQLRREQKPSQHWAARFWTSPGTWGAWGQLAHVMRTGSEGFMYAHGKSFFEYMNDHPDQAETYRQYMVNGYPGRHEAIAAALEFNRTDIVIDIGGGTGALISAILDRNPDVRGIVYDQPDVIRSASATVNLTKRFELREGSFFDAVPQGGSVYILSYILHDWPDEKALAILRSCANAMQPGARLVIVDRILASDPAKCDPYDLLLDMNMLVLHKGQERTAEEFNTLMAASGFAPIRPRLMQAAFSIIETSLL